MPKDNCQCGCDEQLRSTMSVHFAGPSRRAQFQGREHLVVPVVMLREQVLNGSLVPFEELVPQSWNGTPITVGHPTEHGGYISARSTPTVLEREQIGLVFGVERKGDRLVGEAWIDLSAAEKRRPGLLTMLTSENPMDVSVGYFHRQDIASGVHNGRKYGAIDRDLKPDHLALLPDHKGACSWEDGCGVRAHQHKEIDVKTDLVTALQEALGLSKREENPPPADPPKVNEGTPPMTTTPPKQETKPATPPAAAAPETTPDFAAMIKEAVETSLPDAVQGAVDKAVDLAINKQRRADLVEQIAAHAEMEASDLEAMTTEALEKLAAKMAPSTPPANFSGRQTAKPDTGDVKLPGMYQAAPTVHTQKEDGK